MLYLVLKYLKRVPINAVSFKHRMSRNSLCKWLGIVFPIIDIVVWTFFLRKSLQIFVWNHLKLNNLGINENPYQSYSYHHLFILTK